MIMIVHPAGVLEAWSTICLSIERRFLRILGVNKFYSEAFVKR
jgi:hypothetical protein